MGPTLLRTALEMKNLRRAWNEVAENEGIPGVDQLSIPKWRRNWEERLVKLAREVKGSTYKPRPLRLRRIPKPNRREWRELRIPTVTDRVLQRAVLQTLYPVFEPVFLDCSFGYRPNLGLKNAVVRILVLRENGYRWVVDADIDDFFNQVSHPMLMDFLKTDLPDDSLLGLIWAWLEIGRPDPAEPRGIPMGSPLSPLLANVFLHRLDKALSADGYPVVRYADDFLVFAPSQNSARDAYRAAERYLTCLELGYEPHKTRITSFEQGFKFIGVWFQGDTYEYEWEDKIIEVSGNQVDWLFNQYGPDYS